MTPFPRPSKEDLKRWISRGLWLYIVGAHGVMFYYFYQVEASCGEIQRWEEELQARGGRYESRVLDICIDPYVDVHWPDETLDAGVKAGEFEYFKDKKYFQALPSGS